jgi:UDP-GlcNAc:undecaprenyl-phosphate GlcNAc-1-phosphate transferase
MRPELLTFFIYTVFFIGSFGFSLLLYSILLRFARTLGIREKHDIIRWATTAKPALGGITFFIVFLIALVFHSIAFPDGDSISSAGSLGVLAVSVLAFMMGLADDAYNTRPLLKFFIQVACGLILVWTDTSIDLFHHPVYDTLLTVLWVVGIMNSINMLDNMDGISTITSMFIFITALMYMSLQQDYGTADFMILVGVVGALFAFLFYNWHPSRMYMGDTGSQFLGILLAIVGIRYFWNAVPASGVSTFGQQILTLLIGFLLPIVDTTTVSLNRILRGTSPFVGGRDHTTHSLSYMGMSDSQVALSFSGISIVNLIICYTIFRFMDGWSSISAWLLTLYAVGIFSTFYLISRKYEYHQTEPPS